MRRYLSIWLPNWPLTRLQRASPSAVPQDKPFALVEKETRGLVVAALNEAAKAYGVAVGLTLTDARARIPELISEDIDRRADHQSLKKLAFWMIRVAPHVALDDRDGLMLETTGCERYHQGEEKLLAHISKLLDRQGITHQLALGGTPGAAYALARFAPGQRALCGEEQQALAKLPMAGLRLSEDVLKTLRRFGLTRIGQLDEIDRPALQRRFRSKAKTEAVLKRLDEALGRRPEPLVPLIPAPLFAERLSCPEPLIESQGLVLGLEQLTERISERLKEEAKGGRAFTFYAFRADGTQDSVTLRTARPTSDASHIQYLFREHLDKIDPGFGIDLLLLHADHARPLQDRTPAFSGELSGTETDEAAIATLSDRLTSKLGQGSVTICVPQASYIPEKSEEKRPFHGALPPKVPAMPLRGPRPQRLIEPPEPIDVVAEIPDAPPRSFRWRRVLRRVAKADGPERIAPEWWLHHGAPSVSRAPDNLKRPWLTPKMDPRADAEKILEGRIKTERALSQEEERSVAVVKRPRARDYYRVEDEEGRRYWIYREGLYDDHTQVMPSWFMHGLFA